jgi:CHASE2 domain-containing sensor protein
MRKTRIWLDSVFGTTFIFFLIGVVFEFSAFGIFDVLDPIGDALSDVEITDIVFSQFRGETEADENIVLVNIGMLPRAGIAEQINIISKYNPKVIGLDCFFELPKDSVGDSLLASAIANAGNIVMASKLALCDQEKGECDTLVGSNPMFTQHATSMGFANLISDAVHQDQFKTNRTFTPMEKVRGEENYAFAVELANYYDPESVDHLFKRENPYEVINYRGYGRLGGKFFSLDVLDVFQENFDPSIIEDKIVIFGFLGNDFSDPSWEDKYYTPLNENYAGRTNPDMFGMTIHANIIAMILNRDYINLMPTWLSVLLSVFLCYINVYLFTIIFKHKQLWYDGLTKTIQIAEAIILLYIIILIFHELAYKLNITLGIVAILLAGDALEVYQGVIKNTYYKIATARIFRKNS